jgi:outer membrane protein
MMRKTLSLIIAAWLASLTATVTTSAAAADLMAVYRDAMAYDAQYASARATLDAGREKLPQGRSALLPTIGLAADVKWNDADSQARATGVTTSNRYNSNGWSITLTQPLFRSQNWIAYSQSELTVAQAEAQFGLAKMELIVRAAQVYFDVLLAQDARATAQAQKLAIAEQLESAKRNFEVGTATITDTHEAQARFDLASAQEIATQNELLVKQQALRAVIGKEPEGLKMLKPGVEMSRPQPDDISKWAEMAETASSSVQIYRAGLEIAQREVERQRAGHLPTLDLVATRGKSTIGSGYSTGGSDSNSTTVGVQLALPIFSGGITVSKEREAVALREKASADLENARRTAALNARSAYLGVTSGLAQVKAYEAALTSSQSALDSNKLGYEVGVRINIDVLNAQSQLYDTRQKLAKARLDTLAALLKLKAAAGNLSESDVQAINALLE